MMMIQAALLALVTTTAPSWAQTFNLTILHVNDVHSRIAEEDFSISADLLPPEIVAELGEATEVRVIYGGYPRLVTLFDKLHQDAEAGGSSVLRLNAGKLLWEN
jgi:5'-nucleotidase / UDP-sugar diphosphatase